MARGVLFLGAVTSFGCVIPTSLQTVQPPENYPPVLVSATPDPFESEITRSKSDTGKAAALVSPNLVVDDLDADSGASNGGVPETLTARLFRQNPNGTLTYLHLQGTLTQQPLSPTRYIGPLPPTEWCIFTGNQTQSLDMVVVVADRLLFPEGSGREDQVAGDNTDGGVPDGGTTANEARGGWRFNCQ